jgi:hypothetical protein
MGRIRPPLVAPAPPRLLGAERGPSSRASRGGARAHHGLAVALIAVLAGTCCERPGAPLRIVAQEEDLTRQVDDLERLVERAERGALVPNHGVVIAIGEHLVRRAVELALPREYVLEGRYRVRLEKADVTLRDGYASVRLDGRVSWIGETSLVGGEISTELTLYARVEAVAADAKAGTLTARVTPYGFEIHHLRVGEEQPRTRQLIEAVGRVLPEALSVFVTPLTFPAVLEQRLRLGPLRAGPVAVDGASVPLRMRVSDAFAQGGRLFVVVRVDAGPWTRDRP